MPKNVIFVLEIDYIGFDEKTQRLLYFNPDGVVTPDDKSTEFGLKPAILKKYAFFLKKKANIDCKFCLKFRYSSITFTGRIQDAHLYFIKKCLIDYVIDNNKT